MHRCHKTRLTASQLTWLALLAILILPNLMLPLASAQGSLRKRGAPVITQIPLAAESQESAHSRHHESTSTLPPWAYDHRPAGINLNLHLDRFAKHLKIDHTAPPTRFPAKHQGELINDGEEEQEEDEDDFTRSFLDPPHPSELHRPSLRTDGTTVSDSLTADIASAPSPNSHSPGHRAHYSTPASVGHLSDPWTREMRALCARRGGGQADWLQRPGAQAMGALSVFLTIALIIEAVSYMWRTWSRKRTSCLRSGRVALKGDEKQLRAFETTTTNYDPGAIFTNTVSPV